MTPETEDSARRKTLMVLLVLVLATVLKMAWATSSIGTGDTVRFFHFGEELQKNPIQKVYATDTRLNHTVAVSLGIKLLVWLTRDDGQAFVLWLRMPGILADMAIVMELLLLRRKIGLSWAALVLAAASPLHLIICGFHGNLDGVMAAGIFLACSAAFRGNAWLSGFWLGLACHVKIAPVLLAPALAAYWLAQGKSWKFLATFGTLLAAMIGMGFAVAGMKFGKNVLSYGSVWGSWGIPELLIAMGKSQPAVFLVERPVAPATAMLASVLKCTIVGIATLLAWIGRKGSAHDLFRTASATLLVFFALAPGFGHQYLVWWFPIVLVTSFRWAAILTAASTLTVYLAFSDGTSDPFPWRIVNLSLPQEGIVRIVSLVSWALFVIAAAWMTAACVRAARASRPGEAPAADLSTA